MNHKQKTLLVFILFIAGMVAVPIRVTGPTLKNMPGDLGDTRFNNYILEHGYRYLAGDEKQFWNAPFFFPEKDAITYSDNLLGTMPLYAIFRVTGADSETALQLWFISLFILCFYFSWYAFNKISGNMIAAGIGAYIFTFSLPVITQINHVQLLPRFMIPLVMMWCINFLLHFRNRDFAFMLAGIVFQFYCGMYLGFFLVLSVLFFIFCACFTLIDFKKLKQLLDVKKMGVMLGCIILALLLLYPLIQPYQERAEQLGLHTYEEISPTLPRVASYFYTKGSVLWNIFSHTGDHLPVPWEHFLFPGGLVFLAAGVFVFVYIKNRKEPGYKLGLVVFLTLILLVVSTLIFRGDSLYKLIMNLPGFGSMRAISRVILIELLFLSLLTVLVIHYLMQKQKLNIYVISFLLIFTISDQFVGNEAFVKFNKAESQERIENLVTKIKKNRKEKHYAFAYMPVQPLPTHIVMLDGMLASQKANMPTVNGYSSTSPIGYDDFWKKHNEHGLGTWLKQRKMSDTLILIVR